MNMKRTFLFTIALFCIAIAANGQRAIKGEGEIVTQEIQLESFRGVNLGISGEVILTQGPLQKIVLEGQQNILDNVKREVKNDVWRIDFDKNVQDAKRIKVYITLPELTEATVSGSGNLSATNAFRSPGRLNTTISGSGHIKLHIDASEIESKVSGSGSITLNGSAHLLKLSISGSGKLLASDLQVSSCNITISGSGRAEVNCSTEMHSTISGSGNVYYKGEPQSVKATVSGSGNVRKM